MYFKLVVCFLLLNAITGDLPSDWEKFKHDFNRQFTSADEESMRKEIFSENLEKIKQFQQTHPHATFSIGINHLADRRPEELLTGPKRTLDEQTLIKGLPVQVKAGVPISFDWREKGVITEVYDQGQEGKDSSIAAVEVIESYHAIRTKELIKGSIDQVSKCCPETATIFGCILTKLGGGICAAGAYNASSLPCNKSACASSPQFNKINTFKPADEDTMVTLIQESPLYVGIDASPTTFMLYQRGIYEDDECSKTQIDHMVQLVGYGVEETTNTAYWIVKNSWGRRWGDQGYIKLKRGTNTCGITVIVDQIQYVDSAARSFAVISAYIIVLSVLLHVFST